MTTAKKNAVKKQPSVSVRVPKALHDQTAKIAGTYRIPGVRVVAAALEYFCELPVEEQKSAILAPAGASK